MKRILSLLKYESWPNWLGPTIAAAGIGGFFVGRNALTQISGKIMLYDMALSLIFKFMSLAIIKV